MVTMKQTVFAVAALVLLSMCPGEHGVEREARAQAPARPVNNARLLPSLTPGDPSGFPDSAMWTAAERASAVVYAQRNDGGPVYVLTKRELVYGALPWVGTPANATPPSGRPGQTTAPGMTTRPTYAGVTPYPDRNDLSVVGFEVPQLPLGDYSVWVENGPAASAGTPMPFKQTIRIEPMLTWLASSEQVLPDTDVEIQIGIAGPQFPPPVKGSLAAKLTTMQQFQTIPIAKGLISSTRQEAKLSSFGASSSSGMSLKLPSNPALAASKPIRAVVSLSGFSPDVLQQDLPATPTTTIEGRERVRFRFTSTATTRAGAANVRFDAPGFLPAIARIEKYLPPPPPPPPPGKVMPVVFVPGTAGSYLRYADGEPLWLTDNNLDRHNGRSSTAFNRAGLGTNGAGGTVVQAPKVLGSLDIGVGAADYFSSFGGVIQPFKVEEVYAEFLAWADQRFRTQDGRKLFYEAPYDWRKAGSPENARAIDAVVERAKREHGADQVILVAHSLGGIVSRDYLRRLAGRESGLSGAPTKIAQLIAVGTPWLGAPKTARALLWGYNFDVGEAEYFTGKDDVRMMPASQNDDAMFQLVPNSPPPAGSLRFPGRYSLLDLGKCKELAKNWPAVWQQLPSPEFHAFYREARAGRVPNLNRLAEFTSVYGWTQAEFDTFLNGVNPTLKSQTQSWRGQMFGAFDFGVPHYLIAGIVSPNAPAVGDTTDMQIARPEHLNSRLKGAGRPKTLAADYLYEMWTDEYFATDTGRNWGDGTSPLLSASAGAYLDSLSTAPANLTRLRALLGPGADATKVGLGSMWKNGDQIYFGHSSMLNDPEVRGQLWKRIGEVYAAKNARPLGGIDARVVRDLKLEVKTKANGRPWNDYGTFHIVRAQFRGLVFPLNETGNGTGFGLGSGETLTISVQDAVIKDERGWWRRPLESDFEGQTLKFTMPGVDDWVCSSVRFFANGKEVLNDQRDFRLNGDNSRRTSAMTKP